jgi:hypothetical protein
MRWHQTNPVCMVRRRSTVRFRNGAPLKDQVRSSLDSSHPTLRMGVVAVLGIWEIVFCGPAELARSPAWVSREMPGSTAGTGGLRHRRTGTRFQPESRPAAIRTRDDHPAGAIGEPWQRKPGPRIPSRLTGRIIMASLDRPGEGSRLAWSAVHKGLRTVILRSEQV